jgi:hypothetical protein
MRQQTSILWRREDLPGHDFCRLVERADGWALAGVALFAHDGRPCSLRYDVEAGADWVTRRARLSGWVGEAPIERQVEVRDGAWLLDGVECPQVAGCRDIDLGFTPATNTLPIRRLRLAVGEEAEVRAAWLPFPALEFELLAQVYRREAEGVYRYESAGGAFVRLLEVNPVGLVTRYPGLFETEASAG